MGKTKPNKRGVRSSLEGPTGLPTMKQTEKEQELTSNDLIGIDTVIEKLSSTSIEEREYGCAALGIYVSNTATLHEILNKNAVRLVTPLLQEKKVSVQLAASGLLRSITEEGGFEACERMIRQDIFTGIAAFLRDRVASWQHCEQEVKTDGQLHSFINCIYIVQNLCECSALAVRLSVDDSLPQVLLSSLQAVKFPAPVLLAAAQCLYTMSEENEVVTDLLREASNQQALSALIANDNVILYTRVIIAGVEFNTFGCEVLSKECGDGIVTLLISALNADSYQSLCTTVAKCLNTQGGHTSQPHHPTDSNGSMDMEQDGVQEVPTESTLRKELEELDNLLSAQKLSFELLTNLLGEDDTDDWTDMCADDDGDSCGSMESNEPMEDEDMDPLPENPIITTLCDKGLIAALEKRLRFLESDLYENVVTSDKLHRQLLQSSTQGYDSMLASGLLCLNNTLSQVNLEKFGGAEGLQSMLRLFLAALSVSQVSSQQLLVESITSAMRSLTATLSTKSQSVTFDETELNTLQHLTLSSHTATAVNALKCVAAVGVSLSKQPAPNPNIKAIGTLLVKVAISSTELWLRAEALDSIMDVFADDSTNSYITEIGLVSTLEHALPELKIMLSTRDRTTDHFLPVLSTVKSNLPRFIKYKKKVL